jgi:hypothetical protein
MKRIIISLIAMGLLNIASSGELVQNDWFVDEVSQPVKCITEMTDTGLIKTLSVTKYNQKGFKESTIVTLQYGDIVHRKIFVYFQPYQGNQRTVLTSFAELNRQELLKNWHKMDTTIEKWTSPFSYQSIDKTTISNKILSHHGKMKQLSRMFEMENSNVRAYSTEFAYFDSFEDYQSAILGKDIIAIVTLAHDEKGNWVYRKSLSNREQAVVKRFIEYYEGAN